MWLVVLVHVVVQQLPFFNIVLVVLLPIKNLPIFFYDPTCTSRKMLVSGMYEIDVVKRWRLSYMMRLFDVSFSRKVQSD